ncbi:related to microtubule associated protein [Cephalotrichum gorgonifer]|uniref:Related to microtubule associated protein n=1 Tax=Cephalotrichum gorgonifer TaxID=2041049 RepID=A0AAE8N4Z0_9PEZI|nr:related to microtubule associated protein [Cephalotrichum gorgonifer]
MADEEPDYSSLPLTDRFVHKIWKVRKQAYEDAAKQFAATPDESDPVFRPFLQDPGLWKGAVVDSNVAAQQEGIAALCAFLKFAGRDACLRTRGSTITPMVEKALASTRAATKASANEAILLYIELDTPGPVIEDLLPGLSHKVPKTIAATLACLTTVFHNYGCKTVDPKPILKMLPKAFGHADKNVRAEATNLAVEFYRWLREAMKPMFWGDLKPTQQTDLEAQFEKIKAEPTPKQERYLRSQQAAMEAASASGGGDAGGDDGDEEEAQEIDAFDLAEPQDINSKIEKIEPDFWTAMGSSKWKDRKEAVEALYAILNVPRIKEADYTELNRVLAKSMKDANVIVVTIAAQCIEALAKGLRKGYGKYRSIVQAPIMERLKEKKVTIAEALGAALDQVFIATSLPECMEDIMTFIVNKNPQVKEGTMKFLIRCLRTTREVPSKQDINAFVEAGKKLLSESSEGLRSGGAEVLGTIMKIVGERAMNPHLEGLDDIRKTKIKEFYDTAEVKAKEKPKAPPPAAPKVAPPKKALGPKKAPVKKAAPPAAAPPPAAESAPLAPQPTSRPLSKLGKPSGLAGLKAPRGRALPGPSGLASPRRAAAPPVEEETPAPPPQPRFGRGGPAARSLARPTRAASPGFPDSPSPPRANAMEPRISSLERAELEELRAANDRLMRLSEELRHERSKLCSEVQELKNQNAGLIEDHTRDVLSIKAKETQLVRARSDAEATEQTNERLRRELERLKRALSRAEGLNGGMTSPGVSSPTHDDVGIFRDGYASAGGAGRQRSSFNSSMSEEKENGEHAYPTKLNADLRYGGSGMSSGRGSPARGYRDERPQSVASQGSGSGVESWKRAAEVTSQLKARIEQMKAKQGFTRQ